MINRQFFKQMLLEADAQELTRHSMLNHHADGMDYICLHRSPKLTVKIYLIENPQNRNGGYLVNPHSHRYSFGTTVFYGRLLHYRFGASPTGGRIAYDAYRYVAETQSIEKGEQVFLSDRCEIHDQARNSSYWVDSDEIHTIEVYAGGGPLMFGLVQHQDVATESVLYLRPGDEMRRPQKRVPSIDEYAALRQRALELL